MTNMSFPPSLFTSTQKGLVPASGGGTTNFLRADATFAAPPGGGSGVPSGTSFPGGPAAGDQFFRTDQGIYWYRDSTNTRWLSVDLIPVGVGTVSAVTANAVGFGVLPQIGNFSLWLDSWTTSMFRSAAGEWDIGLNYADSANVSTLIDTQDGSADSNATWYARTRTLGSVLSANARVFVTQFTEVSGAASFSATATVYTRLIG